MNTDATARKRPRPQEEDIGFRTGDKGTHTSRTMMLEELKALLQAVPGNVTRDEYQSAVIDANCLGKATSATRRLTFQRLSELYGLDPEIPMFRVLRHLWPMDVEARPLLALLVAVARDPLLAATQTAVLGLAPRADLPRDILTVALKQVVGDRLNDDILDKVRRNIASSWTQSGHLVGPPSKRRNLVKASAVSTAMALYLAHHSGTPVSEIFSSPWLRLLDVDPARAREFAFEAKRLGLIDLRIAGDIIELNLARLDPGPARS